MTSTKPNTPRPELGGNLLGPAPTHLPDSLDRAVREALAQGQDPDAVAREHPTSPLAWATLAQRALDQGHTITGYAFARVGYHRSLDALRRAGWRGAGPVPYAHEANRGYLACLQHLRDAAAAIGEQDEVTRLEALMDDSDPDYRTPR